MEVKNRCGIILFSQLGHVAKLGARLDQMRPNAHSADGPPKHEFVTSLHRMLANEPTSPFPSLREGFYPAHYAR